MSKIRELIQRGVKAPHPENVFIGDDVDFSRISGEDVVIYPGCKISGKSTLILRGARVGYEAPATLENCCLGPEVELKGGFFKDAVFLKKASMGSGAHVREGVILEEQASGAHTVGLKQTILFPFVTLGSLINFCDCFMAGGTSRKNHSEVGSSFIHFNYTPNQDKATPSLIGDVPGGVMLNRDPIFLGGHGGIVGPCVLSFGTVTAAGSIIRKDETREGRLLAAGYQKNINIPYVPSAYSNIKRIYNNNILYLANLFALNQWYAHTRAAFISPDFTNELLTGLRKNLFLAVEERIKRLKSFFIKFPEQTGQNPVKTSDALGFIKKIKARWSDLEDFFQHQLEESYLSELREPFLEKIQEQIQILGLDYIHVVKNLPVHVSEAGTRWLKRIVGKTVDGTAEIIR